MIAVIGVTFLGKICHVIKIVRLTVRVLKNCLRFLSKNLTDNRSTNMKIIKANFVSAYSQLSENFFLVARQILNFFYIKKEAALLENFSLPRIRSLNGD